MAIYRTGQASMDADGYITGYGTKWKTALTLIRPGATIVFASNPVAYATISEIVSDTSLRAISSGGVVVPKGDYVILLHDSLTVDGLAQDVAETLRYYQGQETMYQEFVELLKGFDWKRMEQLGEKAYADAKAAEASANAAKASESNANASKNAAAGSATTASQKATEAANSAGAAKTSETNANASKTAAANSATSAANSATTAGQHKDAAAASASAARTSEGNASSSKNAAAASASAAKTSETNAKASEASATASKNAAKTSEDNAAASKNAAASSASAAAGSATSASNSAATAKSEADRAADLAKQFDATNLMRKDANLSDVVNKTTARANLGLGSSSTVKLGTIQIDAPAANPLLLKSASPCIKFEETDPREGSASSYYLVMDGGNIRMQEDNTGNGYGVFNYSSTSKRITLPHISASSISVSGEVESTANFKSSKSWPALELDKTTIATETVGRRIVIEHNDSSLNFYFSKAASNDGRYTIMMPKPTNSEYRFVSYEGGLSVDGASNPSDTGNDFSTVHQGWRNIGGSYVNSPSGAAAANAFGSLFTQATQGLSVGRAKAQGVNNQWYQQRFYDTSNRIFSRVQTNAAAWGGWHQVTMSAVSDERLKDIKGNLNVEGALDNINRMEFKLFNFKEEMIQGKDKTTRRGVISQQIRMIDKEYVKNVGGYWHLDQTPMLLDGLAAIKALRARDEESKERIAKLEGEVEELKSMVAALIAK